MCESDKSGKHNSRMLSGDIKQSQKQRDDTLRFSKDYTGIIEKDGVWYVVFDGIAYYFDNVGNDEA